MIRYLALVCCCALTIGCAEKEEFTQAVPENDFIEGNFAGRDFALRQGAYFPALPDHIFQEPPVGNEGAALEPRLVIRRMDVDALYMLEVNLPEEALKQDTPLPARVAGTLTWTNLYADSYPGCPHFDTTSTEVLTVQLQLDSWSNDALIGSYRSTDADHGGEGQFSLVLARP